MSRRLRRAFSVMFAIVAALLMAQAAAVAQGIDTLEVQDRFNRLYAEGRFTEAIPLAAALEAEYGRREGELGLMHGATLYQLGNVLVGVSKYGEAEAYLRRAQAAFKANKGAEANLLQTEVMLATALVYQSKLDEGVPLMQRTATAFESRFGISDQRTISTLNNLAQTLQSIGRSNEAEPIYRKLLATLDESQPQNWTNIGLLRVNNAAVLTQAGRLEDATKEMRRGVDLLRRVGNPSHRFLLISLSNLGKLEHDQGNYAAAEALYRECLENEAKANGRRTEIYAGALVNLAILQRDTGRNTEAEQSLRDAITAFESTLGPDHPRTGSAINSLAVLISARGNWREAMLLYDRANAIAIRSAKQLGLEDGRLASSIYGLNPGDFPAHLRAIYHAGRDDPQRLEQAFALVQRSLNSHAAAALSRMAARAAAGNPVLAGLIRQQQDLLAARAMADQAVVAALAVSGSAGYPRAAAELKRIDGQLADLQARLKREHPDYVALDSSEPAGLAEVQRALRPREALVAFVEVASNPSISGEIHAWVVTTHSADWYRLAVTPERLTERVAALRCGLDAAAWRTRDGAALCARLTEANPAEIGDAATLPFRADLAHDLYTSIIAPLEASLREPDGTWRDLLVATSGALSSLPLATLVTEPPATARVATPAGYRPIAWLARRQSVTTLPSVGAVAALRQIARPSTATKPMIGFANPLLDGSGGSDDRAAADAAKARQSCAAGSNLRTAALARSARRVDRIATARNLASIAMIRRASPLPETADEVCAIAQQLHADPAAMRLGSRATETEIRRLSDSGELATYRVLHLATHGTLAGELGTEPGLILTPPVTASDRDDGFLSATEVANLKLDADWVILSACNTAGAAGSAGAEALSGLARAFFFAGARALLVSHWEVDSQSTVTLITRTVSALAADPKLSRAQALRLAMIELIDKGADYQSHPSLWAPFSIVGEGGR